MLLEHVRLSNDRFHAELFLCVHPFRPAFKVRSELLSALFPADAPTF